MKRLWLVALVASSLGAQTATEAGRITQTIDGITCNYASADEAIARALAPLVAAQNRVAIPSVASNRAAGAPVALLSLADFRRNRADYLARIAAAIGLENPTAFQEECYDGYLDNFERTEQALALLMEHARTAFEVRSITIVHKTDLLRRLKAGEKIPGFTLDPDGEHGNAAWKPPEVENHDERITELLKQRDQGRLDLGYNFTTKDGVVDFSAHTSTRRRSVPPAPAAPAPATPPKPADTVVTPFPFIITAEQEKRPPAELASELGQWMSQGLAEFRNFLPTQIQDAGVLANLLLHETTEIGIVERYLGSRDRRWLCEGVANYTAWKIARDGAGEDAARKVYDTETQVAQSAAFREKINLRKWPASENQRKEDADTPLTRAHYAFAARAVFLIAARRGDDFLPKLFQEIGRTPRAKADMRTVERAYKKLAGEDLSVVLAAAMMPPAPEPAAKKSK